jgi:hypothetical protein
MTSRYTIRITFDRYARSGNKTDGPLEILLYMDINDYGVM